VAGIPRYELATFLPRLGVTPRGGNAADGGTAVERIGFLMERNGGSSLVLRGTEFVSEFETKRDQ
jgi:hypothetical protein